MSPCHYPTGPRTVSVPSLQSSRPLISCDLGTHTDVGEWFCEGLCRGPFLGSTGLDVGTSKSLVHPLFSTLVPGCEESSPRWGGEECDWVETSEPFQDPLTCLRGYESSVLNRPPMTVPGECTGVGSSRRHPVWTGTRPGSHWMYRQGVSRLWALSERSEKKCRRGLR